jgi:protein involved in polysaccharide export with SLBB domain
LDVKGLTLDSVQTLVAQEAARIYRNAKVDVSLKQLRTFKVYVLGAVAVPSVVVATAADHVFDVIDRAGGVVDTSSIRGILLVREGLSQPMLVDLQRYISYGDRTANPTLQGGDRVIVPLRNTKDIISISGEVPTQGEYQFLDGDSLSTLLRMAGGLLASARTDSVRLVRVSEHSNELEERIVDMTSWRTQLFSGAALPGDLPLRTGDRVYVRARPRWNERAEVIVEGEVMYPGRYAVIPNVTRLTDVIKMTGGFTDQASLEDAVVIRVSEMKLEDKEFERLKRLPPSEMSDGELQYYRTKSREVKGVMSVSFPDLFVAGKTENNPVMRADDSVFVPPRNQYINVTGSVRTPGRIVYKPGLTYMDYIGLAGGYGFRADEGATLIIKVKGDQFPARSENYRLEPGDNILVLDEPETKFIDVFTQALTVTAQLVTIVGVVLTIVRLQ